MKYFDDMLSKWGFSDGECEPEGVECYRAVYVQTLNTLLDITQSNVRVVAWNRPGVHNTCLIVHVTADWFATLNPKDVGTGYAEIPVAAQALGPRDDAYDDAIYLAYAMDVDDYVIVEPRIDADGLDQRLAALRAAATSYERKEG